MKSFLKSIILVLLGVTLSSAAFGASVTDVNKKKRLVTIDSGKSDGLQKGDKVCFYGPGGEKIGCGKIRSVKKSSSKVKMSKKKIKKVEVGMEATPGADGGGGGGSSRSKLKFAYILSPMMTTNYQKLSYYRPIDGTEETLWEQTGPQSNSLLGFGAEFEMGLSGGSSIAAGGRMKYFREFSAQADYAETENPYAETSIAASAMGFWLDYYYLNFGSVRIGNGLDLDMSTVSFTAAQKTDDGEENLIAEATSKLTTMSLRTLLVYDVLLDPVGLSFGVNFLLPLSASGSTIAEVFDDNASKIPNVDPNEDLAFSLAHKKASFGLEVIIAAYIAF